MRVKKVAIDGLPGEKTVGYVHDLAGRVSRLIYPDGSQARYAYDGAGRLARVRDARGATLASYTHTAASNVATHVVGEGAGDGIATGTFTYNLREWVTEIDYPGKFNVEQRYDAVGNVTGQEYHRAASETPKVAAYTYDRLHRLTSFNLTGGQRQYYRYDRSGNLVEMLTNGSYIYYRYENSSAPNRVSYVYGGGLYILAAYNPNGWMTRMTRNALTYDYRGLLTGHGSAAYTMDPDRRRVKKTAGTAVTYYLRGADGAVLAEYDGSQALTARYVYAGSRRIARVAGNGTSYYLADHLGSTRSLIDEAGNVTAAYDYWPYGKMLASSGAESTHFRFTGHERDAESRLDYMLERSYAYDMGRFLRPDPMQDEYPGISPYVYAANNPLKYVDPDGNNHHEVRASPEAYLAIHAKAIVDHVSNDVGELVRDTAELASDVTRRAIEETIVFSDAQSEMADAGIKAGLVTGAVGIFALNGPTLAISSRMISSSSALGTTADIMKTSAMTLNYLMFDGEGDEVTEQLEKTFWNAIGGRVVKVGANEIKRIGF